MSTFSHLSIPSRCHSVIQFVLVDVVHELAGEGEGQGEEEAKDNEKDLDDVCVGDGDEAAEEGVAKSNDGRAGNRDNLIQVENHLWKESEYYTRSKKRKVNLEGGTKSSKDGSTPEDLAYGCRYGLESAPLAVPESSVRCLVLQKTILFTHFCVKGLSLIHISEPTRPY